MRCLKGPGSICLSAGQSLEGTLSGILFSHFPDFSRNVRVLCRLRPLPLADKGKNKYDKYRLGGSSFQDLKESQTDSDPLKCFAAVLHVVTAHLCILSGGRGDDPQTCIFSEISGDISEVGLVPERKA